MTNDTHPAPRWLRWLAWLPLVIAFALMLPQLLAQATVCAPAILSVPGNLGWLPAAFSSLAFGVLCGLIVPRQPHNRIGWLCGAIAVAPMATAIGWTELLQCEARGLITLPVAPYLGWLSGFGLLTVTLEFMLLPLWFPNGRFLSAGWRRFALVVYSLTTVGVLLIAFWPGQLYFYQAMQIDKAVDNPFGLPFQPSPGLTILVQRLISIPVLVGVLIAQFSLFDRWRRSHGQMRQQTKVFAFYIVTIGTVYMLFELSIQFLGPGIALLWDGGLYMALLVLLWAGYPLAVGVSVLRYRMYDIDILIRKTLQYTAVTALLTIIYFSSVFLLQRLFSSLTGQQSPLILVVSTLLIAALFAPLRRRIQDGIDRRFYRQKYDARQVVAQFARTARDETDMNALLAELERTIQETLQPEGVRVWLRKE
ncbi:MAG: hypothetical protein K1X65_04620 [Caldilineales bacterium]|nr:hypothetical protein [Caldilineales bacterium]